MKTNQTALRIAVGAAALVFSMAAQAQEATTAASEATASGNSDQDIVVTASRRDERLRDVPSAITALDGEKLGELGVRDTKGYLALVPGVSFNDSGSPGLGRVIIRGLSTDAALQLTSTAATYIDDTPFTASGSLAAGALLNPDPDIADVDRIEVLKGPQGTLYGANSLGGLVRIISKRPDLKDFSGTFTADGSTTAHGDEGYGFRGSVNMPIVTDTLALRLNGVYRRVGGFVDNVATGEDDFDWSTIKGARAALRWQPASNVTIDISGFIQDIHNNGTSRQTNATTSLTPLYGRYDYYGRADIGSNLRYRLASASIDYDLGPISLIATGSFASYRTENIIDYTDNYYTFARSLSPAYAAALPVDGKAVANISPNMDKWTGELRAVSKRLGPIEFVAGGFFTSEKSKYLTVVYAQNADGTPVSGSFPSTGLPLATLIGSLNISNYKEVAGFLNGTFYITENLDVGGGIRYAHNEQDTATGALPGGASTLYNPRPRADFKSSDSVATYLATVRFRPTPDISLYARFANGYRPGAAQTNPNPPPGAQTSIRPDTTQNYEAGIKASLGAFSIDASVFHIDWKDIPLNTTVLGFLLGSNGGDAKVDGFELAMRARPAPLTNFSINLGHTNARMSRINPGVQAALGVKAGDKLPLSPGWTATVMADQGIPLGGDVRGDIGATLRFRSDMDSSWPGATINPDPRVPSIATVDLRAGVSFPRFGVHLVAANIFNEFGYNSLYTNQVFAGQQTPTFGALIRPRTLTLSVSANF